MELISSSMPADRFTCARIAAVLGRDVREVRRMLGSRDPDGHAIVSGNAARTYLFSSLPVSLRKEAEDLAVSRGYDCPERLLAQDTARWQPAVPIADIHPEEITRAQKRAAAHAKCVQAYSDGSQPITEVLERAGLAHRQKFGYEVTTGTIENLLRRVIRRDGGRGEFVRWELYLPEIPKRKTTAQAGRPDSDFAQIDAYLAGVNTVAPSLEDRAWVWTAMCDNLQQLLEVGQSLRVARRNLADYINGRAPWLCRSRASLIKCFAEKWERYCAGERFLADRRPTKSGKFQLLPLTDDDQKKLIAHALGGGLAQAWRRLHGRGQLSAKAVETYTAHSASKSYVPRRVRELITPMVKMLDDLHHGPRQATLKGAYITRDWSAVLPGDWYQGDDCTLPVYYWEEGPDGRPRAIRGQFLAMIDCRSQRALAYALHSEQNYNARVIRGLILTSHDTYGLPRGGFYFERGIWKNSRLITGCESAGDELSAEETEAGLRDFGVKFIHARLPRAKLIERVFGILQSRMEHEPGYCGRNEQTEKFERLQQKLRLARAGHIEFSSFLLHRDVWARRLAEITEEYNDDRQDGRLLQGASPRTYWEAHFDFEKPLVRLTDGLRYLLANHRRPRPVTKNGISIDLGKVTHWFRNAAVSHLQGRIVQVYFNPDDFSSVWVRPSHDMQDVVVVPRAPAPKAIGASDAELAEAIASCANYNKAAATLYAAVAPHFPTEGRSYFRTNLASLAFGERTRAIQREQDQIRQEQGNQKRVQRQLANYSRRFGRIVGGDAISTERRLAALKLMAQADSDAHP